MWLRFLRSLGSIIEYEANEINQQREDRTLARRQSVVGPASPRVL